MEGRCAHATQWGSEKLERKMMLELSSGAATVASARAAQQAAYMVVIVVTGWGCMGGQQGLELY